jgi:hypothetical protein
MEPPVSVPSAAMQRSPPTAAALPPELPPGTRVRSCGLRVTPRPEFSVEEPIANSSMLTRPAGMKSCAFRFLTTVAS